VTAADTWSNEANQKRVYRLSRQRTIQIIKCRHISIYFFWQT